MLKEVELNKFELVDLNILEMFYSDYFLAENFF